MSLKYLSLTLLIWSGYACAAEQAPKNEIALNPLYHLSRHQELMNPVYLNIFNAGFDEDFIKDPRISKLYGEAQAEKLMSIFYDAPEIQKTLGNLDLVLKPTHITLNKRVAILPKDKFPLLHKEIEQKNLLEKREDEIIKNNKELSALKTEIETLSKKLKERREGKLKTDPTLENNWDEKFNQFRTLRYSLLQKDATYMNIENNRPDEKEKAKELNASSPYFIKHFKLEKPILEWYTQYIAALKANKELVAFVDDLDKKIDEVLKK